MAMEVAVDPNTGAIEVRRVVCAHDCGLIVNPDALRNQVEGCIVQTLSRTLHEEATFDRSRVTSVDWAGYPVLRFPETPAVEVVLIDRPTSRCSARARRQRRRCPRRWPMPCSTRPAFACAPCLSHACACVRRWHEPDSAHEPVDHRSP